MIRAESRSRLICPLLSAWFFTVIAVLGLPANGHGQSRHIELRSADSLVGRYIDDEEVRELIGNVHFMQTSAAGDEIEVWCDRALRYMTQNKVELFGNVQVVRENAVLRAPEGVYYGNERRAEMRRNVSLRRGDMVLTAKNAEYFTDDKRAFFTGDVVVVDSVMTTTSDSLTYFETDERSIAVGRVRVTHREDGVTVFADSLLHFSRERYTSVPKNPRLVQIDTTSDGTIDTLVVVSNVMESFRDTTNRFVAKDSVVMVRGDLASRSGIATYYTQRDVIILQQQPIVWYAQSQVTGDSIAVMLEERKLRSLFVSGRAMAISLTDSAYPQRYDQLTARELTMHFENQQIRHIDAETNARSLYYVFEENGPNGVNRSSGDKIRIEFVDGKVEEITIVGGVEGQYYPELMLAQRESAYNLDGFRVHQNRPRRLKLEIIP
jgi:lipopolysaccharide export system protein LptA